MTEHRDARQDPSCLSPEDQRLIETLRSQLDPGEHSPARRAAFQSRLEEGLERRRFAGWRPLVVTASAAVAAVALWLALPSMFLEGEGLESEQVDAMRSGFLAYAYYETDYLADIGKEESGFLSDEYVAIATAFNVR